MSAQDWLSVTAKALGKDPARFDDEHFRYRAYLDELQGGSSERADEILRLVKDDPDPVMADSVVVQGIERGAAESHSVDGFEAWIARNQHVLERFPFARNRANEWLTVLKLEDGGEVPESADMSDWLQRTLSERSERVAVIQALAESGRTRRIRARAQERLRDMTRDRQSGS